MKRTQPTSSRQRTKMVQSHTLTRRVFVVAAFIVALVLLAAPVERLGKRAPIGNRAFAASTSALPGALPLAGCAPTPITSGQVVTGSLAIGDCISARFGSSRAADYYSFSGSAGQRVDILTTAASYDDYLVLYGPLGQIIDQDDDSGENGNAWISVQLSTGGLYTLEVTSDFSSTIGNYTFRLNTDCSISPISNGQTITGSLADSDCASVRFSTNRWADRYSFYGVEKQRVDILTLAASMDDYLTLYGPIGQIVAQDDDSGENGNAWISIALPATGLYTLEASSDFGYQRGNYQFRLNSECAILPISNGQTVTGDLSETDCASLRFGTSRWADRYSFKGVAGQKVDIRTTSASFDDYLVLYGPLGQIVAQDDDSGVDGKAHISGPLPATGAYLLEVTSDFSYSRGNYAVRLKGAGSVCAYQLSSNNQRVDLDGGNGSINVAADTDCIWTAVSNASWINLTAGANGTGNGTVTYTVPLHSDTPRTGTLTIAGQLVTITQSDAASTAPFISGASVSGKKLFVHGGNFADGATLFLNGQKQKKTANDEANPRTTLVAKKAGNAIAPGTQVTLEVENPDGSRSAMFIYTRP